VQLDHNASTPAAQTWVPAQAETIFNTKVRSLSAAEESHNSQAESLRYSRLENLRYEK